MVKDLPIYEGSPSEVIGREALAVLGAALLWPLGLIKSKRRTPRLAEQRTVVLVHGYLANPTSFLALKAYLRWAGHKQILSYHYKSTAPIDASAAGLKQFLKKHVRGGRIDLVCHSLGGVVAAVYLAELDGARRVDRCVSLGTPHRGTYNAYWVLGRVGRELRPDSTLLQRLKKSRAKAKSVVFSSIVGSSDNIILPRVFAADKRNTDVVPGLGHISMLFSPEVMRLVARRLAKPLAVEKSTAAESSKSTRKRTLKAKRPSRRRVNKAK